MSCLLVANSRVKKIALCKIGLLLGRTSYEVFILRDAVGNWLNLDTAAVSLNIWFLYISRAVSIFYEKWKDFIPALFGFLTQFHSFERSLIFPPII